MPSGAQTAAELSIGTLIEQRVRFQEEKRQANITSVVAEAARKVEGVEVVSSEPDHDWTARFFGDVQDVSSKEMQALWAAVLAGEVVHKGSVSLRALHVLKNVDQATAQYFRRLFSCCCYMIGRKLGAFGHNNQDARVPSLDNHPAHNALGDYGLDYLALIRLNEHGLIVSAHDLTSVEPFYSFTDAGRRFSMPFEFQDTLWILDPDKPAATSWDGKLTGVALSQAGRDLATAVDLEPVPSFESALRNYFSVRGLSMRPHPMGGGRREQGGS